MLIDPFKATTDAKVAAAVVVCVGLLATLIMSKIVYMNQQQQLVLLILFGFSAGDRRFRQKRTHTRRQICSATCPASTVVAMMNKTTILFRDSTKKEASQATSHLFFSRARARLVT